MIPNHDFGMRRRLLWNVVMGLKGTLFLLVFILAGIPCGDIAFGADVIENYAAPNADLTLTVAGHVKPVCGLQVADKHVSLTFENESGFNNISVSVNCNQYLNVEMQSLNGGFLNQESKAFIASPGFTGFLPYELVFTIQKENAQPVKVNSEDIKGIMQGGSVGVIPYKAKGNLSINWNSEKKLFGGRYRDVIVIRASGKGR